MADDEVSEWQHQGRVLRNRYQLSERLARGSLCYVYRGEDTVLRRSIVVKAVPPDLVACFRAALRGTGSLTHPAVVATYDAIEEDGWLFIVQEYVPARALSAYLRDGIPAERAVDLAAQIARALAYAHAHDVTHGDLNPAAVLIDRQATVRINNFGLPCDPDYLQRFEGVLETSHDRLNDKPAGDDEPTALLATPGRPTSAPAPASESSALPAAIADPSAEAPTPEDDVRALGLLLWQVLSEPVRRTPSAAESGQHERAFRQDVPPAVRMLVTRCVVRSHPERIRDAEAMTLALEALASELAERRPGAAEQTPPALRAIRDEIAQQAPWSVEETLGNLRPWEAEDEEPGSRSPSALPLERRVARPDTQTPVVLSAARMQLPSHPRSGGQAGARVSAAPPPQRASAAVERAKPRQWPMESESRPIHVNLLIVFLIGAALFVLFFLIGFFGPRLLG